MSSVKNSHRKKFSAKKRNLCNAKFDVDISFTKFKSKYEKSKSMLLWL